MCRIWLDSAMQFWRYSSFNVMRVCLDNAYLLPFWKLLRINTGNNGKFISLWMQRRGLTSFESKSVKIGSAICSREVSKNRNQKKRKTKHKARVIFHLGLYAGTPACGDRCEFFCMCPDDVAELITHIKLYVNRFKGFWILTAPNFAISHRHS